MPRIGQAQLPVPSSLPPSGAAGGDLSGTYPNPSVVDDSHNHTVSTVTDIASNYLKLDASNDPLTGDLSLGTHQLTVHNIRPDGSDGLLIESSSGADVALLGAGGGQNATFYDGVKLDAGTASRVLVTDASKNIDYSTVTSALLASFVGSGAVALVDTETNILSSTPTSGRIARSTDKKLFYVADGTNWGVLPINMVTETSAPDGGADEWSARTGYGLDYISDKRIVHSAIGYNSNTTEGSIRTASGEYQIYLNGQWNTIVINFRFLEDSTEGYQLEHNPVGFTGYYDVSSGNSDAVGSNGLPLTQNYSTVGGADGIPLLISGGTF